MSLAFVQTGVENPDAQTLLRELNETLMGILGHNGMAHVCFDDFSQEKGFFLVGYDDGTPVCCAGLRQLDDETGEIKRVYARKNRKGIGAALMKAMEKLAGKTGYRRLVLECREGNPTPLNSIRRTDTRSAKIIRPMRTKRTPYAWTRNCDRDSGGKNGQGSAGVRGNLPDYPAAGAR